MSPLTPDPYKILGVPKDAQIAEIRSAHRKLVLKCHPDKVQDPELKALKQDEFQKVQQAYEILSDEKERARYDDTVQLAELRRQMQQKANISVSRSSPKYQEFEIRTAEPPASSYKSNGSTHIPPNMPNVKVFTTTYPRSWEDDNKRPSASSRTYYDGTETARSSRREATYSDRPSKREAEKERERERDRKDDKERERRKREKKEREEEALRRQEKEDKKKEKKAREKQRSKDIKRETESRHSPYIETWEEDTYVPKPEKKKSSSSKKHDEKRERSSHREDIPPPPSMPRYGSEEPSSSFKMDNARAYIQQSKGSGPERTKAYHGRMPTAPTPPISDTSQFTPPEEPIMRSSARPRPSSGEMPSSRDKYQRPSKEQLNGRDRDEPIIVSASPGGRHAGFPPRMANDLSHSPPHISHVHRTNTMPASTPARPIPMVSRSNTFDAADAPANRGRNRNRHHAQVREEDEYDDGYDLRDYDRDYDRRPAEKERERERDRDRKHRSSKKHRSPERGTETRYHVDNGRAKLYHSSSSYSRKLPEQEPFYYETGTSRNTDAHAAYSNSGYKVKTSKSYNVGDVQYSTYPAQSSSGYRGEYQPVYA